MRVTAPRKIKEPEDLSFLSTAHLARDTIEIDLTDLEWISPLGVVAVLATCLRADKSLGAAVYAPDDLVVSTYLAQIGLLAELERHGWTEAHGDLAERHGSIWARAGDIVAQLERGGWFEAGASSIGTSEGVTLARSGRGAVEDIDIDTNIQIRPHLQVCRLTTDDEVDSAAEDLTTALRLAGYSGGFADDLWTIAAELAANASEHGNDCYAAAQTYGGNQSGTPGVQIAVADFGPGFAGTLAEHHGKMEDLEAVVFGFEDRVSGTGKSDKGNGLGYVAEAVDRHPDNLLHVISNTAHVLRSGGQLRAAQNLQFQGTLASAYMPVPHKL